MIGFSLSETTALLNASLLNAEAGSDAFFSSVTTDTRSIRQGQLFVALSGENFDGHDYLNIAAEKGAVAALVGHDVAAAIPQIKIDDTLKGLGELSAQWRQKSSACVIGVTGSNGKTTLKEMIAAILLKNHSVLATAGNFNNHIGMPLTLMRLQDESYAVIEMGANHPGEISYLSQIAKPNIAVLNNAGRAHLEGFGSVQGVANAKAEIIDGLAEEGTFIFNADDDFAPLWKDKSSQVNTLSFGISESADIYSPAESYSIEWLDGGFVAQFDVHIAEASFKVSLPLVGHHNRLNALAAIAACSVVGVNQQDMLDALANIACVKGRLFPITGIKGSRLIDDSYNANPDSVIAALQVLASAPGYKILILGDLGELGEEQEALHAGLGEDANTMNIDCLMTVGKLSQKAAEVFKGKSLTFDTKSCLIAHCQKTVSAQDVLLIKGSRAAAMEEVVVALAEEDLTC